MPTRAKPTPPPPKRAAAAGSLVVPSKHPGGRPKGTGYRPTDAERRLVERMAAIGVPQEEMVLLLPSRQQGRNGRVIEHISVNTLVKVFEQELKAGKLKADVQVMNAFFRNCIGTAEEPGSVAAQIWYTKTRMGWRETVNVAPGAQDQQPPGQDARIINGDEPNRLEQARRVAFALALGAKLAKQDA